MKIKTSFQNRVWLWPLAIIIGSATALATTNVAPTVVVTNAVQRPGTTFMDIDYRVNDSDDATVQTAALGFVNGGTSLSDIIKISTLVEGTAANLGTNVQANTNLHLTWNVAADWNTNFGNVQVEILAKDGRGLLPFHWITLPAHGSDPELTINDRPIYDGDLLPIWYWLIATGDSAIQLVNGQIFSVGGGNSSSNLLAQGTSTTAFGREFLWQRLNIHSLSGGEITQANSGRYGLQSISNFSIAKGFVTPDRIYGWGGNGNGILNYLVPVANVTAVALGHLTTFVIAGGRVIGWGDNTYGPTDPPANATNVVAIAAGGFHSLALKADGTVIGWGNNAYGGTTIPPGATNVMAIAAGVYHSLALKADGTVVGWGYNVNDQTNSPASATNVVAIAAGGDGGGDPDGFGFSLALKANGTVIGWGYNGNGQTTSPPSATNVVAIAAGGTHSLALKADGTVVVWGNNSYGQLSMPTGLSGIELIGVGCTANHIVVVDKRP